MIINFEFTKVLPKQLFAQVRYFADGKPDIYQNLRLTVFTKDALEEAAKVRFESVAREWERMESQPEVFDEVVAGSGQLKQSVNAPIPTYDPLVEKLEESTVETDSEIRRVYTVVPQSYAEKAEALSIWRASVSVTPRQARLELAKRGQLANIDTIIASLPAEQQELVQIEWEYAVSIERSSPWVIQLGSALGLDEAGLDELFKAASEL